MHTTIQGVGGTASAEVPCTSQCPECTGVHRGLESAPTHPVDHLVRRQQRYHMPISAAEQGMGRSKNLIFCPSTTLFFFSTSPRELVSHFHKQVPETQRRTMLSKSLQSGSNNTAACHHCQKSCGKAWYSPNQLLSPCRHPEQSQVPGFQRMYLSAVSA